MNRGDDLAHAIRERDVSVIIRLMFEGNPPILRPGFGSETELWDFKSDCPKLGREHANAWQPWPKMSSHFITVEEGLSSSAYEMTTPSAVRPYVLTAN